MDLFKSGRNLLAQLKVQSCQRTFFLAWTCLVQRHRWWERKKLRQKNKKFLKQILHAWRIEGLVRLCRKRHLAWQLQADAVATPAAAGPATAPQR